MNATHPYLVDSHAHLDSRDFERQLDDVIARARQAGVVAVLTIATSYDETHRSLEIARRYDAVSAAAGIHPNYAAEKFDRFADLAALFETEPLVGVGETGLDFYRDYAPRDMQEHAFRAHIELALERDLPLIIHVREAHDETLAVLDSYREMPKGVFHCFSGTADYAEEVLKRGFFISIAGNVTFKKADSLRAVAAAVPLGRLLVETDSPYLAPVPKRGRTNEPAFVHYTAQKVAECLGVPFEDVARSTSANAWRLFGVGPEPPKGVIAYRISDNIYLNITNRCPNACPWCVRFRSPYLRGYNLVIEREPDFDEIVEAVGDPGACREVVFCGYGEPTERVEMVRRVGAHFRRLGVRVRLDTNGLGSVLAGRDITGELGRAVDAVSVSLNSADPDEYVRICRPRFGRQAHEAVLDFIRRAKKVIGDVTVTAVDVPGADVESVRCLTEEMGVAFRLRHYRPYG